MLDCVGLEQPEGGRLLSDGPHRSVVDHCRMAWTDFKEFAHSATHGAVVHVLAQLKSHYPSVDLQRVATGYALGTNEDKIAKFEDNMEEPTKRLAEDVELFSEGRAVLRRVFGKNSY